MVATIINLDERRVQKKANEYLRLYFTSSKAEATRYSLSHMTSREKRDARPYILEQVRRHNNG